MRLSIISDEVHEDPSIAFRTIKEEGYNSVELHSAFAKPIEEWNASELAEIKRRLKEYDLTVSNLSSTIFFVCPLYEGDEVTGFSDGFYQVYGDVEAHLNHLKRTCEVAEELESPVIRLFPFRFPNNRKPPFGDQEDMERIVEAVNRACDVAEPYGVTLAVENCPYSRLPKGQMTLELIQKVNRDNLGLLYDPANSYRAERVNVPERYLNMDLYEETRLVAPWIRHVHVKNYHYDPSVSPKPFLHVDAGSGDIDFEKLIAIIEESGYQGAYSLEPEVDEEGTIRSMRWMKETFGK